MAIYPSQETKDRYHKLADDYDSGHGTWIFADQKSPRYQEIVKLGKDGAACILLELTEKGPSWWRFSALYEIDEKLNIMINSSPKDQGKFFKVFENVLSWGIQHELIDPKICIRFVVQQFANNFIMEEERKEQLRKSLEKQHQWFLESEERIKFDIPKDDEDIELIPE